MKSNRKWLLSPAKKSKKSLLNTPKISTRSDKKMPILDEDEGSDIYLQTEIKKEEPTPRVSESPRMSNAYVSSPRNKLQEAKNVSVICRFRPLNKKELKISTNKCVEFLDEKTLKITSKNEKMPYEFAFDRVFDDNSTQVEVFEMAAKPIINSKLSNINNNLIIRCYSRFQWNYFRLWSNLLR